MTLYYINNEDALDRMEQHKELAKENIDLGFFVNKRPESILTEDGVAVISIYGPLMNDTAPIDRELGATDYKQVEFELAEVAESDKAKAVMLRINSPGGTVAGCAELAKLVANFPKPIVAHVEGMACSAAYKIACGADYVIATETSTVGNIGSIYAYVDTSKAREKMGISAKALTNEGADLKSTHYLDQLTEAQLAFLQERINEAGEAFKAHVLANRPISADSEVFRAGWYSGEKAKELGLIDAIGSEKQVYTDLVDTFTTTEN